MSKYYYLAQWDEPKQDATLTEEERAEAADFAPPQNTLGVFDMRPLSDITYGFFATDRQISESAYVGVDKPEMHEFGNGADMRELVLPSSDLIRWRDLLGLTYNQMPDGEIKTLADALIWTFERLGDPEQQARFAPPTATHDGFIEFHLGGHSQISRRPFTDLPYVARQNILNRVRGDMERIYRDCVERGGPGQPTRQDPTPDKDLYRRVASMWCRKYSLDTQQKTGEASWKQLFPERLRGQVGEPLTPHTTVSDDFNRANEALSVGNWTSPRGTGSWAVNSNEVECGGLDGWTFPRYDTALSSDDHYSKVDEVSRADSYYFVAAGARYPNTSDQTGYFFDVIYSADRLRKTETGSVTTLDQSSNTNPSLPFTVKVECDGSTIKAYIDGSEIYSVTDSDISGNVYGGLVGYYGSDNNHGDNFEAADLGGAEAITISAPVSALTSADPDPTIDAPATVIPDAETLTASDPSPAIDAPTLLSTPVSELTADDLAPALSAPATVVSSAETLTIDDIVPGISAPTTIAPSAETLTLDDIAPGISAPTSLSPDAEVLGITTPSPALSGAYLVSAPVSTLTISDLAPDVQATATVSPDAEVLAILTPIPTVDAGAATVSPGVETLTAEALEPSIALGELVTRRASFTGLNAVEVQAGSNKVVLLTREHNQVEVQ